MDTRTGRDGRASTPWLHRASGAAIHALAFVALLTVGLGFTQPPQPDEGALAHVFQSSIVALAPALALYLATADRARRGRVARSLILPAVVVALAFVALYFLEHRPQ